jgi:TatD DNase family protein
MLSGALRMSTKRLKLIDIGANLTDAMFQGIYHGKQAHKADLTGVLDRAFDIGLEKIIVTGGNLEQSRQALDLAGIDDRLYSTVGVHPTYCSLFTDPNNGYEGDPDKYQEELLVHATSNRAKVVAVGECGLDFERLHFCPKEVQLQYFEKQLILSKKTGLPLFLHCRNAFPEFMGILEKNKEMIVGGVVSPTVKLQIFKKKR